MDESAVLNQTKLHSTGRCPHDLVLLVQHDTGGGNNIHHLGGNDFKRVELSLSSPLGALGC